MKKVLIAGLILVASASIASADAYKKCAGCHGAAGEKVALGKSKVISDMSKADIVAALKGYKDGTYGGPMKGLMKGQVASLSDADMQAIGDQIGKSLHNDHYDSIYAVIFYSFSLKRVNFKTLYL